jgi:hypothetical protein
LLSSLSTAIRYKVNIVEFDYRVAKHSRHLYLRRRRRSQSPDSINSIHTYTLHTAGSYLFSSFDLCIGQCVECSSQESTSIIREEITLCIPLITPPNNPTSGKSANVPSCYRSAMSILVSDSSTQFWESEGDLRRSKKYCREE